MAKRNGLGQVRPIVSSIFYPSAIGLALYFIVMQLVDASANALLIRYLTGHWVSQTTTALALIGLVALYQAARRVLGQFRDSAEFPPPAESEISRDDTVARAKALRDSVGRNPRALSTNYRQQRLLAAAKSVEQLGHADNLDEELKYLSDMDAQRQADGYAFVRILIWAIPMLGFLGTVLGITQALGSIQVGPENDFQQMMNGLRTGLYVAFDTTAQALSFAIVLMFVQFIVARIENQLLEHVDRQVRQDVCGWFYAEAHDGDAYVRTVQRMGRSILAATHEMSQTQIELWKRSIEAAQVAWLSSIEHNHEIIQTNLRGAVESAVDRMATRLDESIQKVDTALEHRGQQWQVHLSQLTRQTHEHQQSVIESTQTVLAALRERPAATSIAPNQLLESANLTRALQQLIRTLETVHAAEPNAAQAKGKLPLRVFKEESAA